MASTQVEAEGSRAQLKHLDFVRVLAINAAAIVSSLYDSAKRNSGAYKSTFDMAESAVTAVLGPVYGRLIGVPGDVLLSLDKKFDEATCKFDERAPPAAKNLVSKAQSAVTAAFELLRDLAAEAKAKGPLATIAHAGALSKRAAASHLRAAWWKSGKHPALGAAFRLAAQWSEDYNELVTGLRAKGLALSGFVPLIPVPVEEVSRQVEGESDEE